MKKEIEEKKSYVEDLDTKIICPVCGKYRFDEEFDICPYCHWENDLGQLANPNLEGGANDKSLNQYKKHYKHSFLRLVTFWRKKIKE